MAEALFSLSRTQRRPLRQLILIFAEIVLYVDAQRTVIDVLELMRMENPREIFTPSYVQLQLNFYSQLLQLNLLIFRLKVKTIAILEWNPPECWLPLLELNLLMFLFQM